MIDFLKKIFEPETEAPIATEQQARLAAAVMLVEVAAIDDHFQDSEAQALLQILTDRFALAADEVTLLQAQAKEAQANASSLHDHTRVINERFSDEQKQDLIANMWQIAYADGELDKYEEYIIRRVSELLYVSHSDFIRAKHWARDRA
ncbi:TerB family tellurite resistance protein [Halioxenophilus aromaticivorans]|uniref:TerB family tellurite resistance protein n=1 Tax=Halioxenophilus aromaticivorans TaxID=1306992 RepID=A0AAV3TZY0_9ALTE